MGRHVSLLNKENISGSHLFFLGLRPRFSDNKVLPLVEFVRFSLVNFRRKGLSFPWRAGKLAEMMKPGKQNVTGLMPKRYVVTIMYM